MICPPCPNGAESTITSHYSAGLRWLANTFHGLTWKRFAIFCVVIEVVTLQYPASLLAISGALPHVFNGIAPLNPAAAYGGVNSTATMLSRAQRGHSSTSACATRFSSARAVG
jgi:hypothetical protein